MSLLALLAWITTASGGLYLLAIWLIEYDKDFQSVAATRLPPPVLASHVSLAGGGLLVWVYYVFYDNRDLAWISAGALCVAAGICGNNPRKSRYCVTSGGNRAESHWALC